MFKGSECSQLNN